MIKKAKFHKLDQFCEIPDFPVRSDPSFALRSHNRISFSTFRMYVWFYSPCLWWILVGVLCSSGHELKMFVGKISVLSNFNLLFLLQDHEPFLPSYSSLLVKVIPNISYWIHIFSLSASLIPSHSCCIFTFVRPGLTFWPHLPHASLVDIWKMDRKIGKHNKKAFEKKGPIKTSAGKKLTAPKNSASSMLEDGTRSREAKEVTRP